MKQLFSCSFIQEEIRKALDSVCEILPSTVTKDCEMFVEYYTEEIIFILVSQFPPDKICSSLQLCGAADVKLLNAEQETAGRLCNIALSCLAIGTKEKCCNHHLGAGKHNGIGRVVSGTDI